MKYLLMILSLIASQVNAATKRVHVSCDFTAVAEGYSNKTYSVNMLRRGDTLLNANGSRGVSDKWIKSNADINAGIDVALLLLDATGSKAVSLRRMANEVRRRNQLSVSVKVGVLGTEAPKYTSVSFKRSSCVTEETDVGDLVCTLSDGWQDEYYYVPDSVVDSSDETPMTITATDSSQGSAHPANTDDSATASQPDSTRSQESILRVIRQHIGGFQYTYEKYLRADPGLGGKISLKFTIAPSGEVIAISVVSSNTGNVEFDDEIKDKARRMKFDQIEKGNVTFTYAFILGNK